MLFFNKDLGHYRGNSQARCITMFQVITPQFYKNCYYKIVLPVYISLTGYALAYYTPTDWIISPPRFIYTICRGDKPVIN